MKQASDAKSLADIVSWTMQAKRVTWRRFGANGERRRPIVHRFEVNGGEPASVILTDMITNANPLLARLAERPRILEGR